MPVELGGNPLRLHCMPAWSNWVEIIEITLYACPVESVELCGQIGWKSIEITLYACPVKSVELGGRIDQFDHLI